MSAQDRVWGPNGLVILPDGSFAVQSIYGRNHLVMDRAYARPLPRRVIHKPGDYFTLLGKFSNSGNYSHWIHDGLLRLHGVRPHLPAGVKYLVPSPLLQFQRETLYMLGLHDDQLITFPGDSVWECERLWFASLPPAGAEVREAVLWLREQLMASTTTDAGEPDRRLYLSRRAAGHARVVNEEELAPVFAEHGFDIIQPELMSVVEQVGLFAQAQAIVSPSSAALINLLFTNTSVRTLQILEPRWAAEKAYVVSSFADTLGLPLWYMIAETVENPKLPSRADLYVSPTRLERGLEKMMAADAPGLLA